jgi:hypothetical protein
MSFKLFVLGIAMLALAGCVSAPYSADTGYTQGPPAQVYAAPSYVIVTPPPATPVSICTDTPAGC